MLPVADNSPRLRHVAAGALNAIICLERE